MNDQEKLKLAIVRLERIGMGAGDYLYPDDDTYYVSHSDVLRVLRFLKGWDDLSWCSLCGSDDHADKRCTTKAPKTPSQKEMNDE